jgi:hypothetical protein
MMKKVFPLAQERAEMSSTRSHMILRTSRGKFSRQATIASLNTLIEANAIPEPPPPEPDKITTKTKWQLVGLALFFIVLLIAGNYINNP